MTSKLKMAQQESHPTYISPLSYRRLWYRSVVEAASRLSPGSQLSHWLESHHMVWSQMSSAPTPSHLEKQHRHIRWWAVTHLAWLKKKWRDEHQDQETFQNSKYQNRNNDKLALLASVGVSRMYYVSVLEPRTGKQVKEACHIWESLLLLLP